MIESSSVVGPDIAFLRFAVEKGYFRVQNLHKVLPKATAKGNIEAVKYLLDIGANHFAGPLTVDDLDKQCECRDLMAFIAAKHNEREILQLLLENGYTISEQQVVEAFQMISTSVQVRNMLSPHASCLLVTPQIDYEIIDSDEDTGMNTTENFDLFDGYIQDEAHFVPLEHKFTSALSDSHDLDYLKGLAGDELDNLKQCFPEFSDQVVHIEKYDFLRNLGCDVRPSDGLFVKVIQEHQLEAIPRLIDAGVVLSDKLSKK